MTLVASPGIDGRVLGAIRTIWTRHRAVFQAGEALLVSDRSVRKARAATKPESFALVPVYDDAALVALLYLEGLDRRPNTRTSLARLRKLTRAVAKAVDSRARSGDPDQEARESYLEATPVEDLGRARLLLLLTRNEWNIARVARLMEVTRRTIYLRLARYDIRRRHVPKTRTGRAKPDARAYRTKR